MSKSIITKYDKNCILCGRPTNVIHHMIEGTGKRKLSDKYGLVCPLCPPHHNMGNKSVHTQTEMNVMSHIIAQLAFEKRWIAEHRSLPFESVEDIEDEAREAFRQTFDKSYL